MTRVPPRSIAVRNARVFRVSVDEKRLTSGEVDSLRTIARESGLGERYVRRIFQCAFLAPDIVEAILDGRQPPELTLERFRHPLPITWAEQRRVLGFAKTESP